MDYATIKYDPEGKLVWVARYAGYAIDIAVDRSGNVYVAGNTGLIKYNSSGILEWIVKNPSFIIALDKQENIYCARLKTIKYDKSGNPKWVSNHDGG